MGNKFLLTSGLVGLSCTLGSSLACNVDEIAQFFLRASQVACILLKDPTANTLEYYASLVGVLKQNVTINPMILKCGWLSKSWSLFGYPKY